MAYFIFISFQRPDRVLGARRPARLWKLGPHPRNNKPGRDEGRGELTDGGRSSPQPLSPPWLEQRRNPPVCPSACLEGMEVFTNGREWHFLLINARRYFLLFFSIRAVELDLTNREEVLVVARYGKLKPLSLHNLPISKGREGSN